MPIDRCAVIYYSGVPIFFPEVSEHIGLFIDEKVISKWEAGPIFEHGISAVPYVNYFMANEKTYPKTHRVKFKSLEGWSSV